MHTGRPCITPRTEAISIWISLEFVRGNEYLSSLPPIPYGNMVAMKKRSRMMVSLSREMQKTVRLFAIQLGMTVTQVVSWCLDRQLPMLARKIQNGRVQFAGRRRTRKPTCRKHSTRKP